ncbi:hypothetical protein CTEN210_05677 [Chaetoceros tenuissimus]|uniref:Uncharacterized protein n=1 Tax=Chaetoceros tenuissimus TaxID=426638 RepID=A0AAD3H3Q6_9STRA|nr:hypothetical protein CTEN210_05677 [Chaetoceros tenuissimus]
MTLQFYIDHLPTNFRETNYVQISSFSSTSCFGDFSVWSSRCPERLNPKDFFTDPSYASVTCARTGPVAIADNIAKGKQGEEVFEENKSLLFKQLRVQRIYDEENNTVVYASFNTRLDKNSDNNKSRFKSSVCAVNLN